MTTKTDPAVVAALEKELAAALAEATRNALARNIVVVKRSSRRPRPA
ncbi:MAG: hypothetical protein ACHQ01_01630 [Candidatus Limnocylindrales bacterium]